MKKERKDKHFIKKPFFEGGPQAAKEFINAQLTYPEEARKNRITGTVTVRYTIDHDGKVIDTQVISGIGYGCDEEAERVIRMMRFKVPKSRGVKVQFHQTRHIHFRLPKAKQVAQSYAYTVTPSKESSGNSGYTYQVTIPSVTRK